MVRPFVLVNGTPRGFFHSSQGLRQEKAVGWLERMYLSKGGRITLIKRMLSRLPT